MQILQSLAKLFIPNLYRTPEPVAHRVHGGRGSGEMMADYDPTDRPEVIARAKFDAEYAKHRIGVHVEDKFHGYIFKIGYDSANGIIRISLPDLMPASYGYTVMIAEFDSDPSLKCITRACGELLERHHLPQRYRADLWREAQQKYAMQARGVFEYEYDRHRNRFVKVLPAELTR